MYTKDVRNINRVSVWVKQVFAQASWGCSKTNVIGRLAASGRHRPEADSEPVAHSNVAADGAARQPARALHALFHPVMAGDQTLPSTRRMESMPASRISSVAEPAAFSQNVCLTPAMIPS